MVVWLLLCQLAAVQTFVSSSSVTPSFPIHLLEDSLHCHHHQSDYAKIGATDRISSIFLTFLTFDIYTFFQFYIRSRFIASLLLPYEKKKC